MRAADRLGFAVFEEDAQAALYVGELAASPMHKSVDHEAARCVFYGGRVSFG